MMYIFSDVVENAVFCVQPDWGNMDEEVSRCIL